MKNSFFKNITKSPLKTVCLIGLILAVVFSWGIVLYGFFGGRSISGRSSSGSTFARELRDYDLFDAPKRVLAGESQDQIERRLSRLQRQARSIDEQLSVLKRRRALALIDRRYIPGYDKAAREATEASAFSAPLAAVAAEAVMMTGSPETPGLLGKYATRLSQNRFDLLELSAHVLAGNLENPLTAISLSGLENLLTQEFLSLPQRIHRDLLIDDFLLKVVKGDSSAAAMRLNTLLATTPPEATAETSNFLRMGAEFFYDHGNPLRAAELFFRLSGEKDIAQAADALVFAGEVSGARNIWLALSSPGGSSSEINSRSIYNLAVSSVDRQEEISWLERLFSQTYQSQRGQTPEGLGLYSIIRYTRLLDTPRSIAILEEGGMGQNPLLDLELHRRRLDIWPQNRAAAETWILLNNNPTEEALHEWAAWYFDHQRLYAETAQLLKNAANRRMDGPWFALHSSLAHIREGKTGEGERILKEAVDRSQDWRIAANLGRIQESRRAISAALGYYETAAALVKGNSAAAQIQVRIGRCLEALGRTQESRRALEYALDLDPDNLNTRLELRRLDSR